MTVNPPGLLVFVVYEPYRSSLVWLDLATGATGNIDHEQASEGLVHFARPAALWISGMRDRGALRVTRHGNGIATRFLPDILVGSVSPDQTRAVVGSDSDYIYSHVTPEGFEPIQKLDVERFSSIYGWRDDGVIVSGGDRHTVQLAAPGATVTLRSDVVSTDTTIGSNDGTLLAWVPDAYEAMTANDTTVTSIELILHISSLIDLRAPVRTMKLGSGQTTQCAFAPDDRSVVCLVAATSMSMKQAIAVDVATGKVTTLASDVEYGIAFSPDSRWVALFGETIVLASLDGSSSPVTLPKHGRPIAWLR